MKNIERLYRIYPEDFAFLGIALVSLGGWLSLFIFALATNVWIVHPYMSGTGLACSIAALYVVWPTITNQNRKLENKTQENKIRSFGGYTGEDCVKSPPHVVSSIKPSVAVKFEVDTVGTLNNLKEIQEKAEKTLAILSELDRMLEKVKGCMFAATYSPRCPVVNSEGQGRDI